MRFEIESQTDVGLVRDHNEDSFLIMEEEGIFVVADGLGGHNAGEIASTRVVEWAEREGRALSSTLNDVMSSGDKLAVEHVAMYLPRLVQTLNRSIFDESFRDPEKRGMGTTAILMLAVGNSAFIAHVGDSRLYLLRQGRLEQLTEDHSLVIQLVKQGGLTPAAAAKHPHRNVLLRSIGIHQDVLVDVLFTDMRDNDVFLLATDGLTDMVDDDRIREVLLDGLGVDGLINAAKKGGGRDNITAITVRVKEPAPQKGPGILEKADILGDLFLFARTSFQERVKVARILEQVEVISGSEVQVEGRLTIVIAGRIVVHQPDLEPREIGPRGYFGEQSLIPMHQSKQWAVAVEDSTLLLMHRGLLQDLLHQDQALSNRVLWSFVAHLADKK